MSDFFPILIGIVLIDDLVLTRLPGPYPLLLRTGIGPGPALAAVLAISAVLMLTAAASCGIDSWLLGPLNHPELRLIAGTLVVVTAVPLVEFAFHAARPTLAPAVWPARLTVNCAMLAAVLVSTGKFPTLGPALTWAAGTGLGFGLTTILYAELRRRLAAGDVPEPFRGAAIALVTGGILTLAFNGLAGMLRG